MRIWRISRISRTVVIGAAPLSSITATGVEPSSYGFFKSWPPLAITTAAQTGIPLFRAVPSTVPSTWGRRYDGRHGAPGRPNNTTSSGWIRKRLVTEGAESGGITVRVRLGRPFLRRLRMVASAHPRVASDARLDRPANGWRRTGFTYWPRPRRRAVPYSADRPPLESRAHALHDAGGRFPF